MAKPRKSGDTGGAIVENPILIQFCGMDLSVLKNTLSRHMLREKVWRIQL